MNENTCVCCGRIIPEGRHICLLCEGQNDMQTFGGRPKTNGDRIRQMTDEELADKLTDKCAVCAYHHAECERKFCLCERGVLEWLKQEVSEDCGADMREEGGAE